MIRQMDKIDCGKYFSCLNLTQQHVLFFTHGLKSKVIQINNRNINTARITANTRGLYHNSGKNGLVEATFIGLFQLLLC